MTPTERQNADPLTGPELPRRPMFHQMLDASPASIRRTLGAVRGRFHAAIGEDTLGRLELVLAEVMNNIAEHASTGDMPTAPSLIRIHLCIVCHRSGLACALTDDGISLPDSCLAPRSLPQIAAPELPEGGFGWYLIQDLTQELCYYREGGRNYLAFRIPGPEDGDKPG